MNGNSPSFVLTTAESAEALPAHGELECVCLNIDPFSKVHSVHH